MPITVIPTTSFTKELKRIAKKHRSILADIAKLSAQLKDDPTMGVDIWHGARPNTMSLYLSWIDEKVYDRTQIIQILRMHTDNQCRSAKSASSVSYFFRP